MKSSQKVVAKLGSALYRSIEFIALSLVAPHKVTATLDYRRRWSEFIDPTKSNTAPGLWIHGASVGELEDLASFFTNSTLLKQAGYDFSQLILTSSSPSAEKFLEKMKAQLNLRYAGPIPPDVNPRVLDFFAKVNPELLVLSQSDLWPVLLTQAKKQLKKGVLWLPHKETSAAWGREFFLGDIVKKVGLRQENSTNPLPSKESIFIGSPRIDRIFERIEKAQKKAHPLAEHLSKDSRKKIILGSAWKEDTDLLHQALEGIENQFEVWIIPHETKNTNEVSQMISHFGKNLILKEGILLESYQNFDLAFVGGGLRSGLHNIVEPLSWGIPTFCGADIKKQPEAPFFVQQASLKTVSTTEELRKLLTESLQKESFNQWKKLSEEAREGLSHQRGASERLAKLLSEF